MSGRGGVRAWTGRDEVVSLAVDIDAAPADVWAALTVPERMQAWMSPAPVEIATDWRVGQPILIRGRLHGVPFESRGTVLRFEPERVLRYSHLSSISRLPDEPASYTVFELRLAPGAANRTALTLELGSFPTEAIFKHLVYYWSVTLQVLKRYLEA
jgi:uncharacterized protein YndB with AHSA1/START domain